MITQEVYFLIAPVRSGSTFLKLMLDHHHDISNPGEFDFIFDKISESGEFPEVNAYIDWLNGNRIFKGKGLKIIETGSFVTLIESFVEQLNSKGVLCLNIHRHFHKIPLLFSNARYIHLLRDPRDVARSCIGMGWGGHVYKTVDTWTIAEKSWDKLSQSLDEAQYIELRYEELLGNVQIELTTICHFMGNKFDPNMLTYPEHSTYSKPDKSLSYQWRSKYTDREKELIEYKLKDYINIKGYERLYPSPIRPGFIENLLINFDNKTYKIKAGIKKYGINLYLQLILVRRLKIKSWQYQVQCQIDRIDIRHLK